ncbi:unnamed protein product [Trichobilharzia szidati]|nr:unnamed protein product [Trichobilharzia szidati]
MSCTNPGSSSKNGGSRSGVSRRINSVIDGSLTFFGFNSRETTIEDWNERRLRYMIKRYGSIKGDRLSALTTPVPCDLSGSSLRQQFASSSNAEPLKIMTKRQVSFANYSQVSPPPIEPQRPVYLRELSNVTTFSLPISPATPGAQKPHAMKVILSAIWNPRLRRMQKRTEGIEVANSGLNRFYSAPTGRPIAALDTTTPTTDNQLSSDKWIALKDTKDEETPFLAGGVGGDGDTILSPIDSIPDTSNNDDKVNRRNILMGLDNSVEQNPPGYEELVSDVDVRTVADDVADDDDDDDNRFIPQSPLVSDLTDPLTSFQHSDSFALREVIGEKRRSRPCVTLSSTNIRPSPVVIPSRTRRLTESLLTPTYWASSIFIPHKDDFTEDIFRNKTTDYTEYRPYFTYWITFVHIFIFVAGSIGYGFAPIGLGIATRIVGKVLLPTLTVDQVCWIEYENLWIGPRQTDLIRLGARFPPCMRFDPALHSRVIERQKKFDRASGCCIRNDGGGCYQTHRDVCSRTLATWFHYETDANGNDNNNNNNDNSFSIIQHNTKQLSTSIADREKRTHLLNNSPYREDNSTDNISSIIHSLRPTRLTGRAGPVCGLDPAFCLRPLSSGAFAWSETDVTKWPICELPGNVPNMGGYAPHMECQVTGHPCCLGIKGECIITTQEHCDFVRGFYYPTAALCSQVNCLNQICGMSPFINNEYPNQIYRIFTALFVHAGVMHLILSLGVQMIFMRDLEKMIGWHRIALIYILSGCIGSLTSGIFLPYQVETGPTAAQFSLLGVSLVDFIYCWQFLTHPWYALLRNLFLILVLFTFGLLPWIDNYANAGSFLSGILLSFILLPFRGLLPSPTSQATSIANSVNQTTFDSTNINSNNSSNTPASVTTPSIQLFNFSFNDIHQNKHHHHHRQQHSSSSPNHLLHNLQLSPSTSPYQYQQRQYSLLHSLHTQHHWKRRCLVIILCSVLWILLAIGLIVIFIWGPIINCKYCNYFTCLPLTSNICDNLQVNVNQRSDCILPNWI